MPRRDTLPGRVPGAGKGAKVPELLTCAVCKNDQSILLFSYVPPIRMCKVCWNTVPKDESIPAFVKRIKEGR